jgi:hypothetical protein
VVVSFFGVLLTEVAVFGVVVLAFRPDLGVSALDFFALLGLASVEALRFFHQKLSVHKRHKSSIVTVPDEIGSGLGRAVGKQMNSIIFWTMSTF